jgi:hypothetical protein
MRDWIWVFFGLALGANVDKVLGCVAKLCFCLAVYLALVCFMIRGFWWYGLCKGAGPPPRILCWVSVVIECDKDLYFGSGCVCVVSAMPSWCGFGFSCNWASRFLHDLYALQCL